MKKSNEQGIGDVMKQLFKSYHLDEKMHEVQIKELWEKIMGKSIKNYTTGIYLRNGILTITLDSAPLRQDLQFTKADIIRRVNEELGERVVKDMVIR